ncbi:MAG: hypothetical protein II821_08720 [Treponema sp.]|nr:hypothetical protein [Treponema sp.]
MIKKVFYALTASFLITSTVSAADFQLRLNPQVYFPSQKYYKTAYGGTVQADLQLFNLVTVGFEGGGIIETPENLDSSITFLNGGVGLGLYQNLFSRLYLGAGGAVGLCSYSFKTDDGNESASDMYWRGYGEAGFRFTPTLTLCANGGYISCNSKGGDPILSGPFAGLALKINFSTTKSSKSACFASIKQDYNVYPLYMSLYKTSPVAMAVVTNGESAEAKNVTVSFTAGNYTSSALKSEPVSTIRRMQSVEIPLTVDFSPDLLNFSENGMLSGNLVIEYEILGKKKTSIQPVSLSVSNRNSFAWGNAESLAAYISPDTPEILEYAKYVSGIARNYLTSGMNRNLQFAAAMAEALKNSGLVDSGDKKTPYVKFHLSEETDYIQYPLQTMDFSSGDLDEIGILYASCLESTGVGTGFLALDDDFLVLINTGIRPTAAENHFASKDNIIEGEDTVYFALSMKEFPNGFAKSRAKGAELVKKYNAAAESAAVPYDTHDAWISYPPAVYTGKGSALKKPSQETIQALMKKAVEDYENTDLAVVIKRAKASGDPNKLGLAYVRAGQYANAKAEFNKGIAKGNVASMNNLANVYMLEKNYQAAESQYNQVLKVSPDNKTAKKGLENISALLGR